MPEALIAACWGLLAGAALVLGAAAGFLFRVPPVVVALVMAYGSGVLISAVSFDLVEEAYDQGGLAAASLGALGGALLYTGASGLLARRGARHRKRSGPQQPSEAEQPGSGNAIALGALLDGVPESVAIGTSLLGGGSVSTATVVAVFLSNLPEGLSSASGMRAAGRSRAYVFGLWGGIALISGLAAWAGYALLGGLPDAFLASVTALAGGAILAMIADTMIPEAFARTHQATGLVTVLGFLTAFALSHGG